MATAYIQESHYLISLNQSHLLKAIVFLWTYQTRYLSDDLGCMDQGIWTSRNFDCAFVVTVHTRSISLEFTHLFTLPSFGGLSLRRKIRSIASYHYELTLEHSGRLKLLLCWESNCISVTQPVSK